MEVQKLGITIPGIESVTNIPDIGTVNFSNGIADVTEELAEKLETLGVAVRVTKLSVVRPPDGVNPAGTPRLG